MERIRGEKRKDAMKKGMVRENKGRKGWNGRKTNDEGERRRRKGLEMAQEKVINE